MERAVGAVDHKVEMLDTRVQSVEKDVAAIKAIAAVPQPVKPQWPSVVGAVAGVISTVVSLGTLLIVIIRISSSS